MKLKIQPVNHGKTAADRNRFCGPAVVSALTGCTTGEASYIIRQFNRKKAVMGTHWHEVRAALDTFNIVGVPMTVFAPQGKKPTLTGWLRNSQNLRTPGRIFLVSAGHHWQLISGRRYVCGQTEEIVSIKDEKVKRRARVRAVWEIKSKDVVPLSKHPMLAKRVVEKKQRAKGDPHRNALAKLEKKHGFKVELDGYGDDKWLQIKPCEVFPIGLQTAHYGWDETFHRVEYCLEQSDAIDEDGYYSE